MATATKLTALGFQMLGAAIAGGQLTFTKAVIGNSIRNGAIYLPTADEQFNLTALISPQMTLSIAGVTNDNLGTATITFHVVNENLQTGVAVREIGIYAKVGSDTEKLYAYWHAPAESYEFIHAAETMLIDSYYSVATVIAEAQNVTAIFDPNANSVTRSEFQEHVNDASIHVNLLNISKSEFLNAVF